MGSSTRDSYSQPSILSKRTRRITRACDRCHQYNTKCAPGPNPSTCAPCFSFDEECTYLRPIRRRGPRSRSSPIGPEDSWTFKVDASAKDIDYLVDNYLIIVYPIFPLFHWPSFRRRIAAREYERHRPFAATVLAACGIVAARLRSGAVTGLPARPTLSPAIFYKAACASIPDAHLSAGDFDYLRSTALLGIMCLQNGDIASLQSHLGDYLTLSLTGGFYDETRWPSPSVIEREERRRLFWSTYTLEIFSAFAFGGVVRHRQSQCNVLYPAEVVDDSDITDQIILARDPSDSFLHGWNITTEMYRVLEYLVDNLVAKRLQTSGSQTPVSLLLAPPLPMTSQDMLAITEGLHSNLPQTFKAVRQMTGNLSADRFGFQANLMITLQTVKMAVAGTEDSSVEQRCVIAGNLIEALSSIPTSYITSISAPMLHHVASIGHILAGIIQDRLAQWSLLQLRGVLSSLANLISELETVLSLTSAISARLHSHVAKLDNILAEAANSMAQPDPYPSTQRLDSAYPLLESTGQAEALGGSLFTFSPDHQLQLQTDLTAGWPFDLMDMNGLFGAGDDWLTNRHDDTPR